MVFLRGTLWVGAKACKQCAIDGEATSGFVDHDGEAMCAIAKKSALNDRSTTIE